MTTEIALPSATRAAARVGQATVVEQSRAIAEVQAAVVVAQQVPRDVQAAIAAMRESCQQPALASRAFFRYSRGGSQITGPSVHLARELARVWGNIQYGLHEMRRDDGVGESEMQAFAWDVQTNTRNASTFIVPHRRDTQSGQKALNDLRDIYENNANNGARRVREAIFAVLPPWFVEEAKDVCRTTIESGGGKPIAQRIADAVAWFEARGVKLGRLEDKVGAKRADWTGVEVAQLEVIGRSLRQGETTVADEFPVDRISAADVAADRKAVAAQTAQPEPQSEPVSPAEDEAAPDVEPPPAEADAAPVEDPRPVTRPQLTKMAIAFDECGYADRADRLRACAAMIGRPLQSSQEMTRAEASSVIETLALCQASPDPQARLVELLDSLAQVEGGAVDGNG